MSWGQNVNTSSAPQRDVPYLEFNNSTIKEFKPLVGNYNVQILSIGDWENPFRRKPYLWFPISRAESVVLRKRGAGGSNKHAYYQQYQRWNPRDGGKPIWFSQAARDIEKGWL